MTTYKVIANNDGKNFEHELTIKSKKKKNKTVHELYHSNHETWTAHTRGQLIMTVTDTGDNYEFQSGCDLGELEYDEAEYLFVMLKHIMNYDLSFKLKHKIQKIK